MLEDVSSDWTKTMTANTCVQFLCIAPCFSVWFNDDPVPLRLGLRDEVTNNNNSNNNKSSNNSSYNQQRLLNELTHNILVAFIAQRQSPRP